ncbi:MAG: ferrous iron transport protein A [Oscillospiraceae bacterium]|nr:ferrous iron transport protein A [Oscillospiraceae bacterium]
MLLTMMQAGSEGVVQKIGGKDETRRFLESLGFVEGGRVRVVSEFSGNLIVNIKETRVALSKTMANRIHVA